MKDVSKFATFSALKRNFGKLLFLFVSNVFTNCDKYTNAKDVVNEPDLLYKLYVRSILACAQETRLPAITLTTFRKAGNKLRGISDRIVIPTPNPILIKLNPTKGTILNSTDLGFLENLLSEMNLCLGDQGLILSSSDIYKDLAGLLTLTNDTAEPGQETFVYDAAPRESTSTPEYSRYYTMA